MKKITVTPEKLNKLRPALWGAMASIRRELTQGISKLYQTDNGQILTVIRFEKSVMVVVAVVGKNLNKVTGEFIAFAQNNLCTSIRFHTRNPKHLQKGLMGVPVQLVEVRKGLFNTEYVYKIGI